MPQSSYHPPPEALASEGEVSDVDDEEPLSSKIVHFEDSPRSPSLVSEEFDACPEDDTSPEEKPSSDTEESSVTIPSHSPKEVAMPADLAKGIAQLHQLLLEDSEAVTSVFSVIRSEIIPSMCSTHPCKMYNVVSFNQMLPTAGMLTAVLSGNFPNEEQPPLVLSLQTLSRTPRLFEFCLLTFSSGVLTQMLAWRLKADGDWIYAWTPAFFKDEDDIYHLVSVNAESVPLVMKNSKYHNLFIYSSPFFPF